MVTSTVLSLAVYLDGVDFLRTDSRLGVWVVNLVTERRHLFRKRAMCRCGCRGLCSLWCFLQCLQWQLCHSSEGLYPQTRTDGCSWRDADLHKDLADHFLCFKAVVVRVDGDWAEYAHTLGFLTCAHHEHPCFACGCTRRGSWGEHGGNGCLVCATRPRAPCVRGVSV